MINEMNDSILDRSSNLGKFIDRYLKNEVKMEPKEAHLVFAANRQALMPMMAKKLLEGTHLIADRYAYSGIAYTLAKGVSTIFKFVSFSKHYTV